VSSTGKYLFDMSREPIFEAILRNMVLGNAVHLKKKARIKIEKAAVLIGICDETGTLKEGEVWISVNNGSFEINEA
jgi:RNA-dependent RNA polymerase